MEDENTKTPQAAAPQEPERDIAKEAETPIGKEEAELKLADLELERMQLIVVREKWKGVAAQHQQRMQLLDQRLSELEMERALIYRRVLNKEDAK